MIALVAPLAMTARMEVMRRKKVMTLIAGVILVSIIRACKLCDPWDPDEPVYSYLKDVISQC